MISLQKTNQRTLLVVGAIIIVVLLAVVGLLTMKYMNLQKDPQQSNSQAASEQVIAQVGNIYDIPTDEEPTVAQVKDKNKLKDQPFFDKAKNGDYILVYSKNKLALIYREQANKLINVGPINTEGVAGESTGTPKEQTP